MWRDNVAGANTWLHSCSSYAWLAKRARRLPVEVHSRILCRRKTFHCTDLDVVSLEGSSQGFCQHRPLPCQQYRRSAGINFDRLAAKTGIKKLCPRPPSGVRLYTTYYSTLDFPGPCHCLDKLRLVFSFTCPALCPAFMTSQLRQPSDSSNTCPCQYAPSPQ